MAMLNNQRVYAFAMKIANKHKKLSSNKGVCERRVDFRPPIFFARVKVMDAKKPLGYSGMQGIFQSFFPINGHSWGIPSILSWQDRREGLFDIWAQEKACLATKK